MDSILLALVLAATCAFAFLNGFRDISNSVAAAVRTRALTPTIAVVCAAAFAFLGTLLSSTFGTYLVSAVELNVPERSLGLGILLAALVSAGGWGLFCWWRGIPTSSTHAVISGLAGASAASALLGGDGTHGARSMLLFAVLLPLLVTPLVAFAASYLLVLPATWLMRHWSSADVTRVGRGAQSVSAFAVSLGHGLQDGQRTGAMITLALVTAHVLEPGTPVPFAAQLTAASFLALGALAGGWRITYTLGHRLVNFDPLRGASAQTVSAAMLFVGALVLHLPLSTTQAVTSAIVGAGANQRFETVRWGKVLGVAGYWLAAPVACGTAAAVLFLALHPLLT
ncbi:anion permease [Zafaria sp. Z1313]|uniref:inorganic phosphate transporter n=1 Tax=unclassified Zafaria TaxID=2828765 RepID=UPI002E7820C0|nr:inorganic phosphate transporter [Zafaria sp. J156]MEE1622098.1 inorganic phosphate transporter [Zafaria sp. J156]